MAKFRNALFLFFGLVTRGSSVWGEGGEVGMGMGMGSWRGEGAWLPAAVTTTTTTTDPGNSSFMRGHFRCPVAPAESGDECVDKHLNGRCSEYHQCFVREDLVKHTVYGICCCDNRSTPVMEAVHHRWSCRIHEQPDPSGGRPFCDIFCCVRNGTEGTKCTWLEHKWGWPFVRPGSSSRPCCVGFDGASCQGTCSSALPCCVSSIATVIVAAVIIHCHRKILWERHLMIAISLLCSQAAVASATARFVGHSKLDSSLWVLFTCAPLPLQYVTLRLRKLCRRRRAASESRAPARLAVLLTIETYNSTSYSDVPDDGRETLAAKLQDMGWEVKPYSTGGGPDFESLRDLVQARLEGTTNSEVLLYVSGHSLMVNDAPIILRSDAGKYTGWFRSKSLYTMLREFNQASPENAKFIVFFNGCLVSPTCNHWWNFTSYACRRRGDLPSLRMGSTDVSICCACAPGQEAFVQNSLSKALVEALGEGVGRQPIFESLKRILGAGSPAQTPIIIGTGSQIVLDHSEEAG